MAIINENNQIKREITGWKLKLTAISLFLVTSSTIALGAWFSVLLIIDPNSLLWLNRYLPRSLQIPKVSIYPPQTLTQIETEASQQQLAVGEVIELEGVILIPWGRKITNCSENCLEIRELRLYLPEINNNITQYRLLSAIAIPPLTEKFIGKTSKNQDFTKFTTESPVVFNQLNIWQQAPSFGKWLNLTGKLALDKQTIAYGYILHYNPQESQLRFLLPWTSATGLTPTWKQITEDTNPELVVNQSLDLEPHFQIYEVKNDNTKAVNLQEINFQKPALNEPKYIQALDIAQKGLWSVANKLLINIKQENRQQWSEDAEKQLNLVAFYAQITQDQCQQAWSNPIKTIHACLLDVDLDTALEQLELILIDSNIDAITEWLSQKNPSLWTIITTLLQINPKDDLAKSWGTLMLSFQDSRGSAIAWLTQLPQTTPETVTKVETLLSELDRVVFDQSLNNLYLSKIIGTATRIKSETLKLDQWLQPIPLALNPKNSNEVWYQIEVRAFGDGEKWLKAPFKDLKLTTFASTQQLWQKLGLDLDNGIYLMTPEPLNPNSTIMATIKALRIENGNLWLLATTATPQNSNSPTFLAYTQSAIAPIEPTAITINDLAMLYPEWSTNLLPKLWRILAENKAVNQDSVPTVAEITQKLGNWSIQITDITGNQQPEAILTLIKDSQGKMVQIDGNTSKIPINPNLKLYRLIFSDQAQIIYNELGQNEGQSLLAIADLQDGNLPVLIIKSANNSYILKRVNGDW